jgi:hypothetical protein
VEVDTLYRQLRQSEEGIAKALGISEVAQIARLEGRMREFMLAQWNTLAKKAVKRSVGMARSGKSAKQISTAIRRIMESYPRKALPQVLVELDKAYRLARIAGWKKATGQTRASLSYDTPNMAELAKAAPRAGFSVLPSFSIVDEGAVEALQEHQVFWLGQLYGDQVSSGVADVAREVMVEAGQDREKAAVLMQERMAEQLGHIRTPNGFHGSAKQYFMGVAANAVTTARAVSQVTSFEEAQVTTYEIVNPQDSRTCQVCNHMDGKKFQVEQARTQIDSVLDAETPDEVKKAHPWLSLTQLKEVSPKAGYTSAADSKSLADAGQALPPFHFRCRCAVDVA